ncbi:MAG: adenylate/guanylate cyclase domain-containing protein [Treponema sp.]|jgi:class 3 adenylate cyclase/HAMP domain-containing protein|nr:adenylate/guanylate cyclase domain-containing protein [Treponema sp.]
MKIRSKIILVVLPVIIVTLFLAEAASYYSAENGITRIARQFLSFKAGELEKYAENQWELLAENNYAGRPDMADAARKAVENYARSIILSDTELILALDDSGALVMSTSPVELQEGEGAGLLTILTEENEGIGSAHIGGEERIFRAFYFTPFQWYVLLSEKTSAFYRDSRQIRSQTIVVLAASSFLALLLLFLFARHLTSPLARVVKTMNGIITGGDLSSRVEVEYRDETGTLASTFNLMIGELEKAYGHIRRYAFDAVLAQKKEQRLRNIFQKYVPKNVIDRCFETPESMLGVGENHRMVILFSDIRGFTTISEQFKNPRDLVDTLNEYFSPQVDVIMNRGGMVDKYIGDAIMAFWGAPVESESDPLQAVLAGLDMIDALVSFNTAQRAKGKTEFHIGVGINYGEVTVGNMGSERKMDYTVIGDDVNLASRMEGLTKTYHAEILITENVFIKTERMPVPGGSAPLPFRLLDTVAVKGKTRGVKIYTVKRSLAGTEEKAWGVHNQGMELYYRRDFNNAAAKFEAVLALLPGDFNAGQLLERCKAYAISPPPPQWDGVEVMHSK